MLGTWQMVVRALRPLLLLPLPRPCPELPGAGARSRCSVKARPWLVWFSRQKGECTVSTCAEHSPHFPRDAQECDMAGFRIVSPLIAKGE